MNSKKKYLPIMVIHSISMAVVLMFSLVEFLVGKETTAVKASTFLSFITLIFAFIYFLGGYKKKNSIYYYSTLGTYIIHNIMIIVSLFSMKANNYFAIIGVFVETIIVLLLIVVDNLGVDRSLILCGILLLINVFNFISSLINNIIVTYNSSISAFANLSLAVTIVFMVLAKCADKLKRHRK
ncbi:MAG: hypothetical protein KBT35_07020 [Firmicutes bacterium]|nr:hypothetical protein [Candidatus Colivicinus equi]